MDKVPDRFIEIYDRYFADVYRYVAGRLGHDVADDLAAETFLIAYRKRDRFDAARGTVRPWLFGIATKLVAQHRRQEIRRLRAFARAGPSDRAEERAVADEINRPGRTKAFRDLRIVTVLCRLLAEMPAPPEVRAAAYRALAGMPNVRNLGPFADAQGRAGVGISFTYHLSSVGRPVDPAMTPVDDLHETRFIIDPDSALILSTDFITRRADRPASVTSESHTTNLEMGWTDAKPRIPTWR